LKELELKKDWILITRSGTLGKVVYTSEDNENSIGTDDLVRIKPKNKEIKSGYLYAFLTSKFGYGLLTQSGYGGVVKHIEPHHVENILIPVFPESKQQKINDLIINSVKLRTDAISKLNAAIKYFESKIGVSNVNLDYQTTNIKAESIKNSPKRLDAQYQILWKALKKESNSQLELEKISSVAKDIFVGGRGKRIYVANGIAFLSSSEMMLYNPKRNCKQVSKRTNGLESMMVSKKDILISRSGTVGNTVLIGDQLENTAVSEHALRLIIDPEKISPNYVFCFLKTKYGMKSMEASSFGSVIITLNEELIGNIDMPILPKEDQDEISELIENYITKMDKSVALENEAIDLVEKEIEQWQK
jgi:type I restriction enzyme S subunit